MDGRAVVSTLTAKFALSRRFANLEEAIPSAVSPSLSLYLCLFAVLAAANGVLRAKFNRAFNDCAITIPGSRWIWIPFPERGERGKASIARR